jgi:glutathione S-transferase
MILIGQYDSPFVRRVAIALRHCQVPFEHRPWSVWGNADQIAPYNPLRRVPTLVFEDGSVLVESFSILDAIDELVGPQRALLPRSGPLRRNGQRVAALCTGICDKAVSLLYSSLDLMVPSQVWTARCAQQISDTFGVLERERAAQSSRYWLGDSLSHADIALGCAFRFVSDAHAALFDVSQHQHLSALATQCEALAEFREIYLPITNNL